ncbi:MAG: AgmX/PglI C-terminal domain-containing protein [Myxococcales bacterium]|nr:AgmX/PglI C-terminal domain-containing protein [Myxococcales bacterium]
MSTPAHQPKLMALFALEAGALSPAARARLHRHLQRCEVCQQARADLLVYERLRGEVQQLSPPPVDWRRIEAGVEAAIRETASGPPRRSGRPARSLGWASLAMAACATLAYMALPGRPARHDKMPPSKLARIDRPSENEPVTEPTLQRAWVAAHSGPFERSPTRPDAPGHAPLREGDRLQVPLGGTVDLNLGDGVRIRLAGETEATLTRLRDTHVSIELHRGTITEMVPKRTPGALVEVASGDLRVVVTGTHFEVTRSDSGATDVQVAEGSVTVLDAPGRAVAHLSAPATWSSQPRPRAAAPPEQPLRLATPHLASDGGGWASVALTAPPHVKAWRSGATSFATAGELWMRAPLGPLELTAEMDDGRLVQVPLTVVEEGVSLSARRLRALVPALAPSARAGHLTRQQLVEVVARGRGRMQACYEVALRKHPDLHPNVFLRLRLNAHGRVRRLAVDGDGIPDQLLMCLERVARAWRFPPPGGPLSFEVPLRFRAKGG